VRFVTLGVGAHASPRYAPAGLLATHAGVRVMIDGGHGAIPPGRLDAWLVLDGPGAFSSSDTEARARQEPEGLPSQV
jgi:hypothetical protein